MVKLVYDAAQRLADLSKIINLDSLKRKEVVIFFTALVYFVSFAAAADEASVQGRVLAANPSTGSPLVVAAGIPVVRLGDRAALVVIDVDNCALVTGNHGDGRAGRRNGLLDGWVYENGLRSWLLDGWSDRYLDWRLRWRLDWLLGRLWIDGFVTSANAVVVFDEKKLSILVGAGPGVHHVICGRVALAQIRTVLADISVHASRDVLGARHSGRLCFYGTSDVALELPCVLGRASEFPGSYSAAIHKGGNGNES